MIESILKTAQLAKSAYLKLSCTNSDIKNKILNNIAKHLEDNKEKIFDANKKDLENAKQFLKNGEITDSTYNRLKLDNNKMRDMIQGIYDVAKLDDPVNKTVFKRELDKDLILTKVSVPIGVIGVIFEARPDVIAQITSLTIKSGNSVILKGGKEANNTNEAIFALIQEAICEIDKNFKHTVNILYSREEIKDMLNLSEYIDLIIPRGSNKLVKYIQNNTNIPVLGHASGICHAYIDKSADINKAKNIIIDSKCQYPSACNSIETILINKDFPHIKELLEHIKNNGIKIVENPSSWEIEYGDKILSLKYVENTDFAIEHINKYGSGHTDTIITEDKDEAEKFLKFIDSAGVYRNVSTRFADGFRYGFGAEVGISTNKTHARGPVGLEGLTIYKYIVNGNGDIVSPYANGKKIFTHKNLN